MLYEFLRRYHHTINKEIYWKINRAPSQIYQKFRQSHIAFSSIGKVGFLVKFNKIFSSFGTGNEEFTDADYIELFQEISKKTLMEDLQLNFSE